MRKIGAELIITIMLIPVLLTISGYGLSKTIYNAEDISSLKESDKHQLRRFDRIENKLDLILERVK